MVFSSLIFLFGFAPLFFLLYYLLPDKLKNLWLLFSSVLFYCWGAPSFFPVVVGTTVVDYLIGKQLGRTDLEARTRKSLLCIAITLNLSILGYFKYSNFFVQQVNELLQSLDKSLIDWLPVALPIGISFITFEKISYLTDVYTRRVRPASSLVTYSLFIALFPHLIAGPIFRYHDLATQLEKRSHSTETIFQGFCRFCFGLAQKVLIADSLSEVVNNIFSLPDNSLTTPYVWLGMVCYSYQIYFDFSGYSSMAIGLGKMLGFSFLENFNYPYISQSITEFWRRWHISLSNWMREYLYIPLGGNRVSNRRMYLNLWVVFLLSGLWHGASWNFVIWGAFHGFFLMLDKMFLLSVLEKIPRVFRISTTFILVIFSWVLFRAENLPSAVTVFKVMLGFTAPAQDQVLFADIMSNRQILIFVIAGVFSFAPICLTNQLAKISEKMPQVVYTLILGLTCCVLFFLSVLSLTNSKFHPFIYFRF